MNLLNKLTIKNLKLNKKRTIVTIIGIILSVALVSAVATMYSSAVSSLTNFEIKQKGNFHYVFYDVLDKDREIIKNNRNIESMYLAKGIGYAKLDGSRNDNKPYAYIKMLDKNAMENLPLNLVSGRMPENDHEIIIPTHLSNNAGIKLKVGDKITLDVGKRIGIDEVELGQNNPFQGEENEKIVDTQSKTYDIVGIIERPSTTVEFYSAPGYTFITYGNENTFTGAVDVYARYTKSALKNHLSVTANILGVDEEMYELANSEDILYVSEETLANVNAELAKAKFQMGDNSYLVLMETNPLSDGALQGLGVVVIIVCIIIVVTSVFCIKNSFDISITEKTKQYGMLRSIGATQKQVKKNVFYEATILSLIGIPLGILSGLLASYILIIISNHFLKGVITDSLVLYFNFSFLAIIIAIVLGTITSYLSAFRSAIKASKISPIDSIRNSGNIKINAKKIKSPKVIKKVFGVGGDISYKNLKRNKKKYRTTIISIIISVASFIALASFVDLAFSSVKDEYRVKDYNLSLYIYESDDKTLYNNITSILDDDLVKEYSILSGDSMKLLDPKISSEYLDHYYNDEYNFEDNDIYLSIYTLGDKAYRKYLDDLHLDYNDMKDKAILIDNQQINEIDYEKQTQTSRVIKQFNYQKGDIIKGDIADNNIKDIEVGYITNERPFSLTHNQSLTVLIISDELFNSYFPDSFDREFRINAKDATKVQERLEKLLNNMEYTINNSEENVNMMNNFFTLLAIFLYGFIIVISLIGITNIFNTITTNMALRKGEFAMLKSIGMTTKEFNRMIRLESIFMGTKSLIIGIPIGCALSYLIYMALAGGSSIPYSLPLIAIIISILAVILLITCIMKYSISKINKENIIETIRNENI